MVRANTTRTRATNKLTTRGCVHGMRAGLHHLNRPAYVRVGYEFNGQWNNYPPEYYVPAFDTIVSAWRRNSTTLRSRVAAVWDFSCDASAGPRLNASRWMPDNEPADWWGVNIFSGSSAPPSTASSASSASSASLSSSNANCVLDFVERAAALDIPVMLGESTPRGFGADDAAWSLVHSGVNRSTCIGVADASTTDGDRLTTWACGPGPNQLWRFSEDGYLVNRDGKCVAVQSDGGNAVIGECGGSDANPDGVTTLFLTATPQNEVRTADGALCLDVVDASGREGSGLVLRPPTAMTATTPALAAAAAASRSPSAFSASSLSVPAVSLSKCNTTWTFESSAVGGGNVSWSEWFEPYLALTRHPAVQAFCYIDWFWPR